MLSQRRGVASTSEPLLTITNLSSPGPFTISAPTVSLAGWAEALGETISLVTWTNRTSRLGGRVDGTNVWTIADVPLAADKTNVVSIVATTTSWDAADGGNTTFTDTVSVYYVPIRVALIWDGDNLNLTWTNGVPPYQVQRATDLTLTDWITIEANATPPLRVPMQGTTSFYRILGQ